MSSSVTTRKFVAAFIDVMSRLGLTRETKRELMEKWDTVCMHGHTRIDGIGTAGSEGISGDCMKEAINGVMLDVGEVLIPLIARLERLEALVSEGPETEKKKEGETGSVHEKKKYGRTGSSRRVKT